MEEFFGQALRFVVVDIAPGTPLHRETIMFAAIQTAPITCERNGIMYYKEMGPVEVVDLNTVKCVVGRVHDRGEWAFVDRSGPLTRVSEIVHE